MELFEFVGKEGEVGVDFFGVGDHGVKLVGEAGIFCFLGEQVVLTASAILTSFTRTS